MLQGKESQTTWIIGICSALYYFAPIESSVTLSLCGIFLKPR
jgi:hypothetical protein